MSGTQSQVSAGTQLVSRAEAAPFVRRVALVPGSPDSTPRSIQDMSRSNNRFSVLADPDDVNVEGGVSSGAVHTPVLASSTHKVETVAMDDGDTLVSEVAGSESEASSDIETDESDRESVHSIIRREEEDRAVPLVMEEVPEAIMTPGMHYGYGGSARSNYDPWIREGLASLDTVDMCHLFSMRAVVMKSPPKFLRGAYRSALRIALREICEGAAQHDQTRQTRGWKLLVLLPRMAVLQAVV